MIFLLLSLLTSPFTFKDTAFVARAGHKTIYDVFVAAGQSNMQGFSPGSPAAPTIGTNIGYLWVTQSNTIVDVSALGTNSFSGTTNGPLNPFVLQYNALTGHKVVIVFAAVGGSGIVPGVSYSGGNWSSGQLYETNAVYQWTNCINYMTSHNLSFRWRGVLWCQGEAESTVLGSTTTSNQTALALSNLAGYFKTNMPGIQGGDVPFFVIRTAGPALSAIAPNLPTEDTLVWDSIRNIETAVCAAIPTTARLVYWYSLWFRRDGYINVPNTPHWTQAGYNLVGTNTANEIFAPGSSVIVPNAVTSITATSGNFQNSLSWTLPSVNFRFERIYRTLATSNAWTLVDVVTNTVSAYTDGSSITNGLSYQYRVDTYNEFAQTTGTTSSTVTPTGVTSPTPFITVSGATGSSVSNLWNTLSSSNLIDGMFTFIPCMTPYNASGATLYDLTTNRTAALTSVSIGATGVVFTNKLTSSAQKMMVNPSILPTNGLWSMMFVMSNYVSSSDCIVGETSNNGLSANMNIKQLFGSSNNLGAFLDPLRVDFWPSAYFNVATTSATYGTGLLGILVVYNGQSVSVYDDSSSSAKATSLGSSPLIDYCWSVGPKTLIGYNGSGGGISPGMDLKAVAVWNKDISSVWPNAFTAVKNGLGL